MARPETIGLFSFRSAHRSSSAPKGGAGDFARARTQKRIVPVSTSQSDLFDSVLEQKEMGNRVTVSFNGVMSCYVCHIIYIPFFLYLGDVPLPVTVRSQLITV